MSDFDQVTYYPFRSMSPCFNQVLKTLKKKKKTGYKQSIMECSKSWHEMQTNHFSCLGFSLVKDWVGKGGDLLKQILCYLASPLDLLSTSLVFEDTPQWPGFYQ